MKRSNKTKRPPALRMLFEQELVIDGFAGGGGASTGIEMALGRSPDIAINHDREALALHEVNHPTTRHIPSNIRKVHYGPLVRGRRVAACWFSPDCTYFSKARGKQPFRDRNKARRIRGLPWEAVRAAREIYAATGHYPRCIFLENVEEIRWWCRVDKDGNPDWRYKGEYFEKWKAEWTRMGATAVEHKELRASWFGAPTSRKRLFVIIRFDGQPVVWPEATHGPKAEQPYRTAAECIDFSLPVPSIFLTKAEAKAWGKAHGVPSPKRPLATPSLRRVARGTVRFVLENPEPFLVSVRHQDDSHIHSTKEPLRTIPASDREFAIVQPVVMPFLTEHANASAARVFDAAEPLRTICAWPKGGHFALVAPSLVKYHGAKADGAERVLKLNAPITTLDTSNRFGLVAAFLAKHNGGHEATGQKLTAPADTIVCRENKALVTSHLVKFKGTCKDGQPVTDPIHAIQAHGNHFAEVRVIAQQLPDDRIPKSAYKVYAFLTKFYGSKKDGITIGGPLDTITTKERFALVTVTVDGETYIIVDIGMRMLTPRELFLCQGFPADYVITCQVRVKVKGKWLLKWLTKKAQTRLVGNSVPPHVAAALVRANLPDQALRYAA